jgi:hypothetical protein
VKKCQPYAAGDPTAALLAPHLERIARDVASSADPAAGGGAGLRVHLRLMSEAAGCGVLAAAAAEAAFGGDASGVRARAGWVRRQAGVLTEALWAVHDAEVGLYKSSSVYP